MTLYFITGNKNKFKEAKKIIPKIKQIDLDLPEIQELNPKIIIKEKLKAAVKQHKGEFFCEDTSLYFKALNNFPGPLIKWMMDSLDNKGIYELIKNYKNQKVTAQTMIGYTDGKKFRFFSGKIDGTVTKPKGKKTFGWDNIFMPKGYNKPFSEFTLKEKNKISMRKLALEKLKDFIY